MHAVVFNVIWCSFAGGMNGCLLLPVVFAGWRSHDGRGMALAPDDEDAEERAGVR